MSKSHTADRHHDAEDALTCAIEKLTDEMGALRDAIDELRTDVQWLVQNREEIGTAFQKSLDEISDDIQILVRRALQQRGDTPLVAPIPDEHDISPGNCNGDPDGEPFANSDDLGREAAVTMQTVEPNHEQIRVTEPATTHTKTTRKRSTRQRTTSNVKPEVRQPRKGKPLVERIYFQKHLTDIVRAVGYDVLSEDEIRARLQPIIDQQGKEAVEAAIEELLDITTGSEGTVQLKLHVRKIARQLLGPPPDSRQEADA